MWVLMHFMAVKSISVECSAVESGYIYHWCLSAKGTRSLKGLCLPLYVGP